MTHGWEFFPAASYVMRSTTNRLKDYSLGQLIFGRDIILLCGGGRGGFATRDPYWWRNGREGIAALMKETGHRQRVV